MAKTSSNAFSEQDEQTIPKAQNCSDMTQVRAHIDALDTQILTLLALRSQYVAQAARIKKHRNQVVDQARIDFIIDKVCAQARALGMPVSIAESVYRSLIGASIDFEHQEHDKINVVKGNDV